MSPPFRSTFERLGPHDFNAEAGEPDISRRPRRRYEPDGIDAKVLENLRAEADFAPLPRARLAGRGFGGFWNRYHWHARGAVAQQHQDAPTLRLEARECLMDRFGAAEHVGNDIGAVQPGKHTVAITDAAVDEGHVIDLIERRKKC